MSRQLGLLRQAFRIGELVAPAASARHAGRLWFTVPARRPGTVEASLPEADEFVVDAPDGPVHGRSWGTGPPVHFVHGWGGHGGQVQGLVAPLLARGLRVVTFDAPGHGAAAGRDRRRTHALEFARSLAAVGRERGTAAAIVAHSLGALAVMAALSSGAVPAPAALVLVAPLVEVGGQLERLSTTLGLGPRTRHLLDGEVRATTGLTVAELSLDRLVASYPGRQALVVHDRTDTFAPYDRSEAVVRSWPEARLLTTEGLGHVRVLTDPAVVAAIVAAVTRAVTNAATAKRPEAV